MPLSTQARHALGVGLASHAVATEIADIIDNDTGSLTEQARRALQFACANKAAGDNLFTLIDGGTGGAAAAPTIEKLRLLCAHGRIGDEVRQAIEDNL